MDNPYALELWGQLEAARRRESADGYRLALIVRGDRPGARGVLLGCMGNFLVRLGVKLEQLSQASSRPDRQHIDLEALWKGSRQIA